MSQREPEPTPQLIIPADRLPPGFADAIESPPSPPSPAHPAATAVLLRDAVEGPEVLLLRRSRNSGFVPGAYVFPGGRVDGGDGAEGLVEFVEGLEGVNFGRARARARAGARGEGVDVGGVGSTELVPPFPYWMAAAREVFEETGVLLANERPAELAHWREELLGDRATLLDVLRALGIRLDLSRMVYCAHWVTPVAERRRYDTRFFLTALPPHASVSADPREMSDAIWLSPAAALTRFARGELPMVFPTVKTLEALVGYTSSAETLDAFRTRTITPVLPRLVRTAEGVGIMIEDEPSHPHAREIGKP